KDIYIFQQYVFAVRNKVGPVFFSGLIFRRNHKLKVGCLVLIGNNIELIAVMRNAVFKSACSWLENFKLAIRFFGIQYTEFGSKCTGRAYYKIFLRFLFIDISSISIIFFMIHQYIILYV